MYICSILICKPISFSEVNKCKCILFYFLFFFTLYAIERLELMLERTTQLRSCGFLGKEAPGSSLCLVSQKGKGNKGDGEMGI